MPEQNTTQINLKKLTDEQLFEKVADLQKKIVWAQRFSSYGQGITQMQNYLTLLENERYERMYIEQYKMMEKYISEPIETDPSLRDKLKEKIEEQEMIDKKPKSTSRPFPIPTMRPMVSEDNNTLQKRKNDDD